MKPRILVAETDSMIRESWTAVLETAKYDVEQARTSREALYRFCIQKPDLMVLSLDMAVPEGLNTITLMRDFHPNCPLVILAAQAEEYAPVVRAGMDTLLKKPVEANNLLESVQQLLKPLPLQGEEEPMVPLPVEMPRLRRRRREGRHYQKRTPVSLH